MYHSTVLYVHIVAYGNAVDISAEHGTEPYRAVVAHGHVAYYGCGLRKIAVVANLRCESSYLFYYSHFIPSGFLARCRSLFSVACGNDGGYSFSSSLCSRPVWFRWAAWDFPLKPLVFP